MPGPMETLVHLWRVRDLRRKVIFVLGMLVIFRIAANIPIPGVDVTELKNFFQSNQILGLLNVFSGGALENFSIVMLGVGPYITSSIIMQLLMMIIPRLEQLSKEGEAGQRRINQVTRLLTVPLAILQGYATITLLQRSGGNIIGEISLFNFILALITITAGTVFLMWIGELISEKQIGNGVSLLIFAGIIASLPTQIRQTLVALPSGQVLTLGLLLVLVIVTIAGVVVVTEGQRNIPVAYARRIRGNKMYGGVNTHLPMRVNQAGVIPIIFAVSLVVFPPIVAQFFVTSSVASVANAAQFVVDLFNNQIFYGVIYFVLVVVFTYFYTAVIFHPDQMAENLQKQGGFIPGIRPGKPTELYLSYTSNRILLAGALFLGVIAILPFVVQSATGISTLVIGGTSLLIVVSVVIETMKQINAQLVMREYEGF